MINHYDLRKKIEIYLIAFIIIVALCYGGFRAYPILAGPSITIYTPHNNDTVASTTFEISGKILRAKEIILQGRTITIDTEGNFTETLVASFPYTIIILSATDSYNKTIIKTLRVIPK